MARLLLQYLLPLLLPFLAYFAYVAINRRGSAMEQLTRGPWLSLLTAGVALLIVSLVGYALLGGAPPDTTYVPPRLEDGQVIPGDFSKPQ